MPAKLNQSQFLPIRFGEVQFLALKLFFFIPFKPEPFLDLSA